MGNVKRSRQKRILKTIRKQAKKWEQYIPFNYFKFNDF